MREGGIEGEGGREGGREREREYTRTSPQTDRTSIDIQLQFPPTDSHTLREIDRER